MPLRRVIAGGTSRHGRIARFEFINVREEGPTMVSRLPQQVLLLLVLVAGRSAEAARESEEARWAAHGARRTSRSSRADWPTTRPEHATTDSRPDGRMPETTAWIADRSSPGSRLVLEFPRTIVGRSDGDEDTKVERASAAEPDEGHTAGVSSTANYTIDENRSNGATSTEQTSRHAETRSTISAARDVTTTPTSLSAKEGPLARRHMRHAPSACEKFEIGDEAKREFYSPNYPDPYPNLTECVRVLKADKDMLLKLDFRDDFKLEDSPDCRFDSLEVRDGQHGFSNLLGNFCGSNFPPEITSKTRYLWLKFRSDENIEYKGFKAVWSMIPRPTYPGVPPEPEPCILNVTDKHEAIIHSNEVAERKKIAEKEGLALDCMWIITVKEGWKIQLTFEPELFDLQRPNECDANFVDVFNERTDLPSREKNFCGSIADTVNIKSNVAYVRFYAEPKALNSSFESIMTAIREKDAGERYCKDGEYDCEDATCIAAELLCNERVNCRFRWDEDEQVCGKNKSSIIDKQHIVIILVVFSFIVFGMSFAFVFNCIRKLVRDHRIIREHIRQSRENRLDELGRKATPCPISVSRTDIGARDSESPSLEVMPSKELLPATTLIAHEYTKELVLDIGFNGNGITDIHQSNNVSNATQERLQESSEEPEMRDNYCQTRESLFEPRQSDPLVQPAFTTFGFRAAGSQNGTNAHQHHLHHRHLHYHPQSHQSPRQSHHSPRQSRQSSLQSSQQSSQPSHDGSHQQQHQQQQQTTSQCSGCNPASRGRDGSMGVCPKHNPIPAPPGWSSHESGYPLPVHQTGAYPDLPDYPSYQRFQSPKPGGRDSGAYHRQSPKFVRQTTVGSGERYGSSIYGSGPASSNATPSTPHSGTPKCQQTTGGDPRYKAEAVIEVDQRRPFSIESTKSAPDVIATH